MRLLVLFLLNSFCGNVIAQTDSIWQEKPIINFSGFVDIYYVYDFNQPTTSYRQPFLYNHNRHNEFNLNLGFAKVALEHKKYRANLALQAGTYAIDNYAAEPGILKNIFEANAGISLNKKNNLWLDAGIFASHIGFESAISLDNLTLTRSLLAENSPYYLTGTKISFEPNKEWQIAFLIVNGWQRIQRLSGNSLPSFGTQVNFSPVENITFNWSTFTGTDDPDSTRRMRYFNNFYGQFLLTEKFSLTAGFDIGTQQRTKSSSVYDIWLSPVIIGQFALSKNWKTALRVEYYQDETGIIIPTGTTNGFKTTGLSWNFDYSPTNHISCRLEGRWLNSKDQIFETANSFTNDNFFLGTSIAVKLQTQ